MGYLNSSEIREGNLKSTIQKTIQKCEGGLLKFLIYPCITYEPIIGFPVGCKPRLIRGMAGRVIGEFYSVLFPGKGNLRRLFNCYISWGWGLFISSRIKCFHHGMFKQFFCNPGDCLERFPLPQEIVLLCNLQSPGVHYPPMRNDCNSWQYSQWKLYIYRVSQKKVLRFDS